MTGLLQAGPSPESIGPGFAGFVAIFAVAVATVLLLRSMVGHLRKVRYSPDPAEGTGEDAPEPTSSSRTGVSSPGTGVSSRGTGASSRETGASSRETGASSRETGKDTPGGDA